MPPVDKLNIEEKEEEEMSFEKSPLKKCLLTIRNGIKRNRT